MALFYQAEYRIGRRGGRVCRSYTGFRAFLAILFDLGLGLFFDVLGAVLGLTTRSFILMVQWGVRSVTLCCKMLVWLMTLLVELLALPHKLMQNRSTPSQRFSWRDSFTMPRNTAAKPDWPLGQEV